MKSVGEVLLLNVTHHAEIAHTELRDSAILVASLRLERTEDRGGQGGGGGGGEDGHDCISWNVERLFVKNKLQIGIEMEIIKLKLTSD